MRVILTSPCPFAWLVSHLRQHQILTHLPPATRPYLTSAQPNTRFNARPHAAPSIMVSTYMMGRVGHASIQLTFEMDARVVGSMLTIVVAIANG